MTQSDEAQPRVYSRTESCVRRFVRGIKDRAKMTHAETALLGRGLGAKKRKITSSQGCYEPIMAKCADAREGIVCESRHAGFEAPSVRSARRERGRRRRRRS